MGENEQSEPVAEQAETTEKKTYQTYDWDQLELEFTTGPKGQTLRQFGKDKNLNEGTLYGKAEELKWRDKKIEYHKDKNAQLREMCVSGEVLSCADVLKGIGAVLSKMFAILDDAKADNPQAIEQFVGLTERMVNTFLLLTDKPTVREAHDHSGLGDEDGLRRIREIVESEGSSRFARTSDN